MGKQVLEINPGDRLDVAARPNRIGVRGLLLAAAGGALLAYLMDPDRGRSRRAIATDRLGAEARRASRQASRFGRHTTATLRGWRARAAHLGRNGQLHPDDGTLAHRVETELFRDPEVPKGRMNVNVENGVVVLRGTVDDEVMSAAMERKVQRIPGVVGVRNLLHRPGTAAPNWPAHVARG